MAFEPNLNNVVRYSRTFNVLDPNAAISPFYFMAAATTGVAGDVVKYDTQADTVAIAASGALSHEIAGFLMQDVKDLDGGVVKGYRNLNNSVVNYGDNVGIWQGRGTAETKRYYGTAPAVGNRLCVGTAGQLRVYGGALEVGDPIAVVEATVGSATVEPQQLSTAGGNSFIRIRVYNL